MEDNSYDIVQVIAIDRYAFGETIMKTHHNESDPLGGAGSISWFRDDVDGPAPLCLSTNCQLNAMWTSPSGNLWVVDDFGDVYTTADVRFPAPPYSRLDYHNGSTGINWHVTRAFHGQLNGIWGTSDEDVWVTSFMGPVLHWNGREWSSFELPKAANGICGSASDNIYVVGYGGQINHWNGHTWTRIPLPAGVLPNATLTDVTVHNGTAYISSSTGCLLIGSATEGFHDLGSPSYSWYGIGLLNGRIFLAGGEQGIFEYTDSNFIRLKERGHPVGVFVANGVVNFIPAEQHPRPWFVRYDPGASREWTKTTLS